MGQNHGVGKVGQLGAASRITKGYVYPRLIMPGTVTNNLFYLLNPRNKSEASTKESILEMEVPDPRRGEATGHYWSGIGLGCEALGQGAGHWVCRF